MKLWSFLRSRRLAVVLLIAMTVYTWVVTLVPLESLDRDAAAAWDLQNPLLALVVNALGLHRAYSSPIFIVGALLLTASTAACAWERTRAAFRTWRARTATSGALLQRLQMSPLTIIELDQGIDAEEALSRNAASLRRLRMRVQREPELLTGTSGALGLTGSPLFHWALVGLFVFVALGQLTRYEGYVNMVVGDTVQDAPAAYSVDLARGPLSGLAGFTGDAINVNELDLDHNVGGVARGRAALVRLSRDGTTLQEQWVFPNSPLRQGPLTIHRATSGPVLVGTVATLGTAGPQALRLYYDESSKSPRQFSALDAAQGTTLTVEVTPVGGRKVTVTVRGTGSRPGTQTIGVGESATLAEGMTFSVDALTYYVQLQVVNDWSVPWIYAMFGLGILGMVMTTFVPPRTIRVMVLDGERGLLLHVATTQRNNDPAFPRRAERTLREGLADFAVPVAAESHERRDDA